MKTEGDKEPNVVRPDKYIAQEERLKELTAKNQELSKTVSDYAKALSELKRKDASAAAGFARLEKELKALREFPAGQDNKSSAQYSDFVAEIPALEKTHAATIAEKTKVPVPANGNTNAGLNTINSHGSGSHLDEEQSKTVSDSAKALSELERKDASDSVGFATLEELEATSELAAGQDNKSSAQYSDFVDKIAALEKTHAAILAMAEKEPLTAEYLRNFARLNLATLREETSRTCAGVVESPSKFERLNTVVAAFDLYEEIVGDPGNPSEKSIDMQPYIDEYASAIEPFIATLELTVEEKAVIGAILSKAFIRTLSIIDSTEKFIAVNRPDLVPSYAEVNRTPVNGGSLPYPKSYWMRRLTEETLRFPGTP
jgi:hypothetical protein